MYLKVKQVGNEMSEKKIERFIKIEEEEGIKW